MPPELPLLSPIINPSSERNLYTEVIISSCTKPKMKLWTTILFLPIFYSSFASAHFSFFGFGSSPTEAPVKASEGAAEAASSNSATLALPGASTTAAPSGFTSILFGTGVTGTQGTPSPDVGVGSTGNTLGGSQNPQPMGGIAGGMGHPSWNSATSGQRVPVSPSSPPAFPHHNHVNNAQTQTKGHGYYHPSPALSQPPAPGLPLYNPHLSSNLATHSPGMPLFNTRNPQPHLTPFNKNQQQNSQGFSTPQVQKSNSIRFNEIQDNRLGGNNDGFGNTGKTATKTGSFSWMSPEGEVYEVNYVADAVGHKSSASAVTPIIMPTQSTFYAPPPPNNPFATYSSMTSSSPSSAPESSYSYTPFKPMTSHSPPSTAPNGSYK